ncbi:MAG: SMC-Scp complex subunit ScpB [bacterium]|nr:SMC-Scp complex subunit ScpB [bacterium]
MSNLEQKIQAILFFKSEPVSLKKLADTLKISEEEARQALANLKENLNNTGIVLLELKNEFALGTSPEFGELIEDLQKEDLNKELSKASLETLSIVLYKNGATRAEIDYIRGVNSSFTLRALSIRGLVERVTDSNDSRRYIYKPTLELLSFVGVTAVEELPEYNSTFTNLNEAQKNLEASLLDS